jgi:uncharacterized protein YdhG (YjbR/CyaY superfamily)
MATRTTTKKSATKNASRPARKVGTAKSVDEFLAAVPSDKRAALMKLRATIRAAAPKATEGISYGVPMFKLDGRPLVSVGYGADHCSFYVQSPAVMTAHAAELKAYATGKGSIRFAADEPLPAALVTKLVKARIAEVGKKAYR